MSSVRLSYDGIGEMLRADWMVAEMERRAAKVLVVAEATAPVGPESDPHRGRYKESFSIASRKRGGIRYNRSEAIVWNDAPEALYVEYGNRNTPRHATLRRALNAARD